MKFIISATLGDRRAEQYKSSVVCQHVKPQFWGQGWITQNHVIILKQVEVDRMGFEPTTLAGNFPYAV